MKNYLFLLVLLSAINLKSQAQNNSQRFPEFPQCAEVDFANKEVCFKNTLKEFILNNYKVSAEAIREEYKGEVTVIFEVDKRGDFQIIYLDAVYPELKKEMQRVFNLLPQIKPATYNSRPTFVQFKMPVKIPLALNLEHFARTSYENSKEPEIFQQNKEIDLTNEYDKIQSGEFTRPRYESQINIPLSHEFYSRFDAEFNKIGVNTHAASKPLLFSEVSKYYDFKAEEDKMLRNVNSWVGRKLFNEHLVQYQTEDYWFTLDFALDLQLGKDFQQTNFDFTYNNTRALIFQGGLGKNFNFYTVAYENQGRFADYYNRFAESIRPDGGDPAIIPGRGIAKPFMDEGYDYPVAAAIKKSTIKNGFLKFMFN
jgi:hypothetical protein